MFEGNICEVLTEPPIYCFLVRPLVPVAAVVELNCGCARFDFIDLPLILRDCITRYGGLRVNSVPLGPTPFEPISPGCYK